jgi:hypothetical protein
MTGPAPDQDQQVQPRQIADLLAWARRLSHARHHADPAERAAFLAAKADLLTRLTHPRDEAAQPTTKDT